MKKLILITFLISVVTNSLSFCQSSANAATSVTSGNSKPGLLNITELNAGIGLNELNRDYAKRSFNLTSILGTGITRNLTGGIGVGVSLYNGGTLVPLFADFRYFFNLGKTRFFALGDGGIFLNSAKIEGGPKYLISSGAGIIFPVSKNLSINTGAALFTQFGQNDYGHDSFVNIKLGVTYLFIKD